MLKITLLVNFFLQVTNYGLGGLCEQHIDPHGYLEGMHLPRSRESLKFTGDMIGTFMAWLTDVGAGGGTSYTAPGKVQIIWKGQKKFWKKNRTICFDVTKGQIKP